MAPAAHTCLILELDLAANPVAGQVVDRLGTGHPFAGWMALTRTIELTLDAARQATPVRQASSTPEMVAAPDPAMPRTSADLSTAARKTTR